MPQGQNNGGGGKNHGSGGDSKKAHFVRFKLDEKGLSLKAVRLRATAEKKPDNVIATVTENDELTSDGVAVNGWYEVKLADGRKGYVSAEVVDLNTQKPENRRAKRGEIVTRIKTLFEQLRVALEELQTLE